LKKSRNTESSLATASITILGKCYLGPDTTRPLDSGAVEFSARSVQATNSYPYWQDAGYLGSNAERNIQKGGDLVGHISNVVAGDNYVLVIPHGFALQWWDGTNPSEQPSPVSLTTDTVHCDFHFSPGCSLLCTMTPSMWVTGVGLVDTAGLYFFPPTPPFDEWVQMDAYSVGGIPIGTYYLTQDSTDYVNVFYPDAGTKNSAAPIRFTIPGTKFDTLTWSLQYRQQASDSTPSGTLDLRQPDTSKGDLSVVLWNLDLRRLSWSETSADSLDYTIGSGQEVFAGRLYNGNSFFWYPGTFLRSQAETLSVPANANRQIVMPIPSRSQGISGRMPLYSSASFSYTPVLTSRGQVQSLGASANTDTSGGFFIMADKGSYSLWMLPTAQGNTQTAGWGAFGVDSVSVTQLSGTVLSGLKAPWNTHSIEGAISCRKAPLVACFDTNGRAVSATQSSANDYYLSKIGPRARFFYFDLIAEKPYNALFCLNFLSPGRYAVVKIEQPDSIAGLASVSWYGGPEFKWRFVSLDDVTLLKMPGNISWVTVDSSTSVVSLPSWTTATQKQPISRVVPRNNVEFHVMADGRIVFEAQSNSHVTMLRIFAMDGRLLDSYQIMLNGQTTLTLGRKFFNKPLILEVGYDHGIMRKALFCK
jgi:hypothetical protein